MTWAAAVSILRSVYPGSFFTSYHIPSRPLYLCTTLPLLRYNRHGEIAVEWHTYGSEPAALATYARVASDEAPHSKPSGSSITFMTKPKREAKERARNETMSGLRMRAGVKMRVRPMIAPQSAVEATESDFTRRKVTNGYLGGISSTLPSPESVSP